MNDQCKIYFAAVDDYLSREEKLDKVKSLCSMVNVEFTEITPDEHGDWLNQRRDDFMKFIPLDGKKNDDLAVFSNFSLGINTNRDAWSYNASRQIIASNFTNCISFYNSQVKDAKRLGDKFIPNFDKTKIAWAGLAYIGNKSGKKSGSVFNGIYSDQFRADFVWHSLYRPFFKEFLYNDKFWTHRTYQMPKIFPYQEAENFTIVTLGIGTKHSFSCCMTDCISCLGFIDNSQCFPRYVYRKVEAGKLLSEIECSSSHNVEHNYIREDAIKPDAVEYFKQKYPDISYKINADSIFYYIYGVLHSPEYRTTYANNLQRELPRIPCVKDFLAFERAGRQLASLHLNYETIKPYDKCIIQMKPNASFYVEKLKYGKIKGKKGNDAKDKTVIFYNQDITIRNIPIEVQEYVVNKKSALDWIVERCCISQDKDSKIINNYNDYAKEIGDEKYIFNLILRIITVSLETMKIVKALPPLNSARA